MRKGAVVLCGGKSTRMGRDKASLPFGPETMLQRVVRILSEIIMPENMVVVAAAGQTIPTLSDSLRVARDQHSERGPLEGLAAGLKSLPQGIEAVFVTSCDVPLLQPEFVRMMFDRLGSHTIAVPIENSFHHPLASVYRPCVLPEIQRLLNRNRLRPRFLFDLTDTVEIPVEELRVADPELRTLMNLNGADDYERALQLAGFR